MLDNKKIWSLNMKDFRGLQLIHYKNLDYTVLLRRCVFSDLFRCLCTKIYLIWLISEKNAGVALDTKIRGRKCINEKIHGSPHSKNKFKIKLLYNYEGKKMVIFIATKLYQQSFKKYCILTMQMLLKLFLKILL